MDETSIATVVRKDSTGERNTFLTKREGTENERDTVRERAKRKS